MMSLSRFKKSMLYALRGLVRTWQEQQNFRIQVVAALGVFSLAWVVGVTRTEWFFLVLVSLMVCVLELLNTIFEHFTDFFAPRFSETARVVKDVMAAAVLLASLGAVAIGLLIFWPYLLS